MLWEKLLILGFSSLSFCYLNMEIYYFVIFDFCGICEFYSHLGFIHFVKCSNLLFRSGWTISKEMFLNAYISMSIIVNDQFSLYLREQEEVFIIIIIKYQISTVQKLVLNSQIGDMLCLGDALLVFSFLAETYFSFI